MAKIEPQRLGIRHIAAILVALACQAIVWSAAADEPSSAPYPAPLERLSCDGEAPDGVIKDAVRRAAEGDRHASLWLAQHYLVCERPDDDDAQLVREIIDWYVAALGAEPRLLTTDALWFLSDHFDEVAQADNGNALTRGIWEAGVELDQFGVVDFLKAATCASVAGAADALEAIGEGKTPATERAPATLGEMYKLGKCVPQSREKAIRYYQLCMLAGQSCHDQLSQLYATQPFSDAEEAFYLSTPFRPEWLSQAVRRGSTEALPILEKMARGGDGEAALELGHLFHGQTAVRDEPLTAARWLELCAVGKSYWFCDEELMELISEGSFAADHPSDFARMAIGIVERGEVLNYPQDVDDISLLQRVLDGASTVDDRQRIAAIFYEKAVTEWDLQGVDRIALVKSALSNDATPARWTTAAHAVYAIAQVDHAIRNEALTLASEYLSLAGDGVDGLGLARLAFLKLMESRLHTPDDAAEAALTRSVALGSSAAQNTLDWLRIVGRREFVDDRSEAEKIDLCSEDGTHLSAVISEHFKQARELYALRGGPPPVTVSDVSSLIEATKLGDKPAALLIYGRGWDGQCVWLLDAQGVRSFEKVYAPAGSLEADLRRLYEALGIPEDRESRDAMRGALSPAMPSELSRNNDIAVASTSLSRLLLPGAIAGQLNAYANVFVAPFGAIGSVPFNLLKTNDEEYASERSAFIILAGLSEIPNRRRLGPGGRQEARLPPLIPSQEIVVLGDPRPSGQLADSFSDLAGAEQEAIQVANLFAAEPFLHERATSDVLVREGARSKIIYFAGHAVAASTTVEKALDESYLVMADGKWTARNIQSQSFSAEIAVLSACQTGLGFEHFAGTIGLSRAFAIAGVPQVVMSLWSVDDQATQFLMTEFMGNAKNLGYVDALQRAMQVTRRTFDDPTQWAGFTFFAADINSFMVGRKMGASSKRLPELQRNSCSSMPC